MLRQIYWSQLYANYRLANEGSHENSNKGTNEGTYQSAYEGANKGTY